MPALEPLYRLIGFRSENLTKVENILLETELFSCICEELKETFKEKHKNYFKLMKFGLKKENVMLDANLGRLIIEDILSTKEYDAQGIAHYTDTHEDVIQEIIIGTHINPSGIFIRKLIELHRYIRRELYSEIIKKIINQYTSYIQEPIKE